MDEGNFAAHARGREGRAHATVTAADDDEVKLAGFLGLLGQARERHAPRGEGRGVVRGAEDGVGGEEDGVATAVEAGEVAEGEGGFGFREVHGTAVVPRPVRALGAEGFLERRSLHEELKLAGCAGGFPAPDPVHRADPHAPGAGLRELHGGAGVRDGCAEAVGHEVGRAHRLDELRVEHPAAGGFEGLGLDEDGGGVRAHGEEGKGEEEGRGFMSVEESRDGSDKDEAKTN